MKLSRDFPNTIFKQGDQGTIVEFLITNEQQPEADYLLEMFHNNETHNSSFGFLDNTH